MPLEATYIIIDNTEWMRNEDYTPSRLKAQNDAVGVIFNAKTQSNAESVVGIISHGGKAPELQCSLTNEMGNILVALHNLKIGGSPHFVQSLQVAALGLKHRSNMNQSQRIVIFTGSPLTDTEEALKSTAKKLKRNNVAVDVVSFGEEKDALLSMFVEAVSNGDNCHYVHIPIGPTLLSDALVATPILAADGYAGQGGGAFNEFGVDANMDPELALALRISMEEERARQGGSQEEDTAMAVDGESEEDKMLAQAIAMSMDTNMTAAVESLPGVDPNDPRLKEELSKKPPSPKKK